MSSDIVLRRMELQDIPAVTALCAQLGYPATEADVERRFRRVAALPEDALLVAVTGESVVGWIHLHVWHGVESGPDVELGGLVVDERHRGRGIGRLLMAEAERWGRERGCTRVRFRSNVIRTEAHAFYQRLGYRIGKTQYAFEKVLAPG